MSNSKELDPLARLKALREQADEVGDDTTLPPKRSVGTKVNIASFDFAETESRVRVEQVDLFAESDAPAPFDPTEEPVPVAPAANSLFNPDAAKPVDILSMAAAAAAKSKTHEPRSIVLPLGHTEATTQSVTKAPEAPASPTASEEKAPEDDEDRFGVAPLPVPVPKGKTSLFEPNEVPAAERSVPKLPASATITVAPVSRRSTLFDDDDDSTQVLSTTSKALEGIYIPKTAVQQKTEKDLVKNEEHSEAALLIEQADQAVQDNLEAFGTNEGASAASKADASDAPARPAPKIDNSLFSFDDDQTSSSGKIGASLFGDSGSKTNTTTGLAAAKNLDDDLFAVLGSGNTSTSSTGAIGDDFNFSAYINSQTSTSKKTSLFDD